MKSGYNKFTVCKIVNLVKRKGHLGPDHKWKNRRNKAAFSDFFVPPHFQLSAWYFICLALFCQDIRGMCICAPCSACFTQALNSNDLLSEWQTQQMLTLSNAKCLSSPPCFCPVMALRRGEQSGHLTLSGRACVCVQVSEHECACVCYK